MGPAEGVALGAGLVPGTGGAIEVVDLEQVVLRDAGDRRHLVEGIALIVLLQHLIDAARILQGVVTDRDPGLVLVGGPGVLAVLALLGVIAGEQAVVEGIALADDLRGVGIVFDILFLNQIVVDDVLDHPAQEGDVGAGTQRHVMVAAGRGPGETRIDMDQRGAPILCLEDPLEGDRVVFGGVAAHDKDTVTVLQVNIVVRHRTAAKRLSQSRYGGAVSDAGLVIDMDETHGPAGDGQGPAFLVADVR